jgi:hypothetical protein
MRIMDNKELEDYLQDMRDKIAEYLEWSNNANLDFDSSKLDIARAGLRDIDNEIYYLLCK